MGFISREVKKLMRDNKQLSKSDALRIARFKKRETLRKIGSLGRFLKMRKKAGALKSKSGKLFERDTKREIRDLRRKVR